MSIPSAGRYAAAIAHIPMPPEIQRLPIHPDFRIPLPWFCEQDPPDFRVVRAGAIRTAHVEGLCWITGEKRYPKRLAFVVGPMSVISRTSAELPARPTAARYAAVACPFMANPRMRRNETDLPEGTCDPAGIMIRRNPGVAAVLITDSYEPVRVPGGGVLFRMGRPLTVEWYARGRQATREEVMESIESGLPTLREMAEMDGEAGVRALAESIAAAQRWLPTQRAA